MCTKKNKLVMGIILLCSMHVMGSDESGDTLRRSSSDGLKKRSPSVDRLRRRGISREEIGHMARINEEKSEALVNKERRQSGPPTPRNLSPNGQ